MELAGNIQYETHRAFFKAGDKFCSMRFEIFSRQTDKPLPSILMIDVFDSSPDNTIPQLCVTVFLQVFVLVRSETTSVAEIVGFVNDYEVVVAPIDILEIETV